MRRQVLWIAACIMIANTMVASAETAAQLAANKKLVQDFSQQVFDSQNLSQAKNFLSDDVIEHNPNIPSGLKGFVDTFTIIFKPAPPNSTQPSVADLIKRVEKPPVAVLAEGDKVLVLQKLKQPDPTAPGQLYDTFFFDLYRIKDGKIVEHWDAVPKQPHP